jgi:CheY-like chemotaxis protein
VGSGTGSSPAPELGAALHRLRSTLARLKAELELAEADGTAPTVARLLADLDEAFEFLAVAEYAMGGRVRVLVVDDDERLAEITAKGLRRLGYRAEASASLRTLQAGEVLVVDLGVLEGLGEAGVAALRPARPVVVTGAADRASRALAASADASDYLVKPVDLEELAAAIDRRASPGV